MGKKHSVIIIPGLGDKTNILELITRYWKRHELEPIVYSIGWRDGEYSFKSKLRRLLKLIDQLTNKGNIVSLVGTSAGGSAVLNAFIERKDVVYRVVTICGRLRTGPTTGFRSFGLKTVSSPSFAESIKLFEAKEKYLDATDRQKVMTIHAMFGDELVPKDTTVLDGAFNISIPTLEHMLSIGAALTIFSKQVITFLKGDTERYRN